MFVPATYHGLMPLSTYAYVVWIQNGLYSVFDKYDDISFVQLELTIVFLVENLRLEVVLLNLL